MYRLVRKLRARIKIHEAALVSFTLSVALICGSGVGRWYVGSGRETALIASVNAYGAAREIAEPQETATEPVNADARSSYDLFAAAEDVESSGFFTSPRASQLQPASGYTASFLSVNGEPAAPEDNAGARDGGQAFQDGDPSATEGGQAVIQDDPAEAGQESGGSGAAAPQENIENLFEADAGGDGAIVSSIPPGTDPDAPVYTVKIVDNDKRYVISTVSKTVSDLLFEHNIKLAELDRISGAYLEGVIDSDLYIQVKRVTQKTTVEDVKINAKTVYRDTPDLARGETRTVRSGSDGLKRVEYVITYENGEQVGKTAVKEEILTDAVSYIVEQGSSGSKKARDGSTFTYSMVIDVKCTAYTSSYEDTGKRPGDPAFGITKSGMPAREGVVAVDPSVIALGTKMYIEILDESVPDYGYAIAGDTGGKIKGKKVDLYFEATREQLLEFGVRKAKVYIID